MKKLIAKSMIGREFSYNRESAMLAPVSSAKAICEELNRIQWHINPGECWSVHDCGAYELEYTAAGYKRITTRKGALTVKTY